ncbi:TIGR00730 family Rossman fold protein [Thermoflavimicrobium daqui]|uniref:Cytokinin riboside 5'-monophosphate phosphoribohydrolase n=1 Tax=Thermoflavimicrobium daqui TaxID=2137476 RepID=A0A364K1A7_9BACL|nr:TIGR00730 family Rossman fold protein [Thermoflavimicrobium daqui]RAL21395.1 TIGR00730 family Rossman fold protein [Thermoflavimicrobium daqui]
MKRICVFAGSNRGRNQKYTEMAINLGKALAKKEIELVYGGSSIGLMGVVADEVLNHHGKVIGVIPSGLLHGEIVHQNLTELYQVKGMHERKAKMAELSDGFIALPGGYGTFEEIFEVLCWGHLGIHQKPIGLLNIDGYYQPLMQMVHNAIEEEFIPKTHDELFILEEDPERLLEKMNHYVPPADANKWRE